MSVQDCTLVEIRIFHHNGTRNIVTLLSSLLASMVECMGLSPGQNRCTFAFVAFSGNRQELAETFKNVAKLASCSRDDALSLLPSGHRSKGGLASASPPPHSKRTVQHTVER
jgi:hypothetical protein